MDAAYAGMAGSTKEPVMENKIKAVYTIVEGEKLDRPMFRRVGTAFVNRDASLNILLDALPVSGRLHVRDADLRRDDAGKEVAPCNA
jgi:hypothetical protein